MPPESRQTPEGIEKYVAPQEDGDTLDTQVFPDEISEAEETIVFEGIDSNRDDSLGLFSNEFKEKQKKPVSIRRIWEIIKDRVIDITPEFIISRDVIVERYAALIRDSISTSKAAARFFNLLARHRLGKPEIDHEFVESESALEFNEKNRIKYLLMIDRAEPRKSQVLKEQAELVSLRRVSLTQEQPIERRYSPEEDYLNEEFQQTIAQDGGENTVTEAVFNRLYQKYNYVHSILFVNNKRTGQVLDLAELLPNGFIFRPTGMYKKGVVRDKDKTLDDDSPFNVEQIPVSVADYNGTQTLNGGFSALKSELDIVQYGNLKKKGGMLTLLHEIAHAWQFKYSPVNGRKNWMDFYNQVTSEFIKIQVLNEYCDDLIKKGGVDPKAINIVRDEAVIDTRDRLDKMGVSLHKNDEVNPSKPGSHVYEFPPFDEYLVESDKVKPLIEDFVSEERDAWAHALRVLRFLRKKGFDLEPELKTVDDFEEVIHWALGTYQDSIDSSVKPTDKLRKFTRKSRYTKEKTINI